MDGIMYSLHKYWCDKIFSGEKTLDFRTQLPKNLKKGTRIYMYETKQHDGSGKVVGECIVNDIIPVLRKDGKWPIYGCYPFIEYYFENIVGDFDFADYIRNIKNEFEDKFENYKYGFILYYIMSQENLTNIRNTGRPIDTWKISDMNLVHKILDDIDMANEFIQVCDDWLTDIGYYNDIGESYYKWGISFGEIVKYDEPIDVTNFLNQKGVSLKNGPHSFCYVNCKNSLLIH
jgi:hypothetical protein